MWLFNGQRWTEDAAPGNPPPLHTAVLVYEARTGDLVEAGYVHAGSVFNVWRFDGARWRPVPWSGTGSVSTVDTLGTDYEPSLLAGYDDATGTVDLWQQDGRGSNGLWLLDSQSRWRVVALPAALKHAFTSLGMAYDAARQTLILVGLAFGGFQYGSVPTSASFQTWMFNGQTWTETASPQAVYPANQHRTNILPGLLAYDPPMHGLVFVHPPDTAADYSVPSSDAEAETWLFDNHGWRRLFPTNNLPARLGGAIAFDQKLHALIVYGGGSENARARFDYGLYSDLWAFRDNAWMPVGPPSQSLSSRSLQSPC
jgi:hypothetical protein